MWLSKLSNSGISLNWSIIVNTTAYFFGPLYMDADDDDTDAHCSSTAEVLQAVMSHG